ncbi:MAG: tRNA epoxyqueuosine(34) reductase QueG [Rikenellaceae bacterium]|nr:tRNA epoxyqueuosine(34) reductase QueG [Rikenellaceae bacterium]
MDLTARIKAKALELGFDDCGVAPCRPLAGERVHFERWLAGGCNAGLGYLERNRDKRFDPGLLVDGARTVIVCAVSYNRGPRDDGGRPHVASYAWARDYHYTIREQLTALFRFIRDEVPGVHGRVFVDTAPLHEKSWAVESGLGWIGKHSLLVHPRLGSFVLLGELVVDLGLVCDEPFAESRCGSCTACIDACPNRAIIAPKVVDARRCIARLTIEAPPRRMYDCHGWVFGCDLCQLACPHNVRAPVPDHAAFRPVGGIERMTGDDWRALTPDEFDRRFGQTPLGRSSLDRIQGLLGRR